MTDFAAQYFSLNIMLLVTLGLWPYKQSKFEQLRFIFFLTILTTAILFQFATFLTSKCTVDFVVKILTNAFIFTTFAIIYIFFAINTEIMKDLLTQLQNVCDELRNKYENAIIEKYSYYAKRCTILLTTFAVCCALVLCLAQFYSIIINVVLSINISQSRLPIKTEYFVDEEKYFFLILLHIYTAFCVGAIAVLATAAMFLAYLIHICGLFEIASYRIGHAMRTNMLQNINPEKDRLILKEIICGIHMHRQAMKLSKDLASKFEIMLSYLIITGVISLSLNIFQISRIVSIGGNINEIVMHFGIAASIILYMFCATYIGQSLTDYNKHIFVTVYNVQWHMASLHIQKIILFLLQRSAQEFNINIGGLFVASLESFSTLVKASVSYFTVIYSTQE